MRWRLALLLLILALAAPAEATLAPSLLINLATTTDAASYATATISPAADALILIGVYNKDASAPAATPTITGCSMTWVEVVTGTISTATSNRLTTFRGLSATPGSACALTIDFAGVTQQEIAYIVQQWTGADTGGTNGSGAIVQAPACDDESGAAVSSVSVTLSAFGNAVDNHAVGFFARGSAVASTAGGGFTILGDVAQARRLTGEYRMGEDTTVDMSWGNTAISIGCALEVKAAVAAPSAGGGLLLLGVGG